MALEDHPAHEAASFYKECVGDFKGKDPLCRKIDVLSNFIINYIYIYIPILPILFINYIIYITIRKNVYIVVDGNVRRVERTCGYERSKLPCYKADNDYHFETVCQCFTDGCNGSTKLPIFTLSFIIILGYINYLLV